MEIPNDEFTYNSYHRYSVICPEYFHCYQQTLNQYMNLPNDSASSFDTKWLIEGTAAVFEALYIQQYYGFNYILDSQNHVHANAISSRVIMKVEIVTVRQIPITVHHYFWSWHWLKSFNLLATLKLSHLK